jgi:hypothetical protein
MSIIGSNILAGAAGSGVSAYEIEQSLRFNSADSARLTRTPSTAGNRRVFTTSFWVKRGKLSNSSYISIFNAGASTAANNSDNYYVRFRYDDVLNVGTYSTSITDTTAVLRDLSAWYHVVVAMDQNDTVNSCKVYLNGVLSAQGNTVNSTDLAANNTVQHSIGYFAASSDQYLDGYLAEFHHVDGTRLTPSSFGEYDDNNVWRPIEYTGGSYGTNGFYLKFDPTATNGIGHDHSGNGNNFSPTGFSTSGTGTDVMSDTPTTNWATLNPLSPSQSEAVLANGNLDCTWTNVSGHTRRSTIAVGSGKWYAEITRGTSTLSVGLVDADLKLLSWPGNSTYGSTGSYAYRTDDGSKYNNGSGSSYGSTVATGDVIGIAYDGDNGALYFSKNGTWQNSGDPTSGASATGAAFTGLGNQTWTIACGNAGGSTNGIATNFNFGQRAFAYTPPTGYKALNTANLPAPDIKDGSQYFDTKLYTGTDATLTVNYDFGPDFVWIKSRSHASDHSLYDIVRGTNLQLRSNSTNAEINDTNGFNSFNTNGFTLGIDTGDNINAASRTYVAWAWDAGGSGSSNTDGTITSTVSANPTAGFSIATYTGTGSNASVGHGLGVTPSMCIIKQRNTAQSWWVWHQALGNNVGANNTMLELNGTSGTYTADDVFREFKSTTFFR